MYLNGISHKIVLIAILGMFLYIPRSFAQGRIWFGELNLDYIPTQKVINGNTSYINTGTYGYSVNINNGGRNMAIGMQFSRALVELSKATLSNEEKHSLNEFFLGLRYYPLLPTTRIGTALAIRLTAGIMAGFYSVYYREKQGSSGDWQIRWTPASFDGLLYAGFCLSPFRNTTGLTVKFNYRPGTYYKAGIEFTEPYAIQAGLFIGPRVGKKRR